jgi:hypothetical protein
MDDPKSSGDQLRRFLVEKIGLSQATVERLTEFPISFGASYVLGKELLLPLSKGVWKDLTPEIIKELERFLIIYLVSQRIIWFVAVFILIFVFVGCGCLGRKSATLLALIVTFFAVISIAVEADRYHILIRKIKEAVSRESLEATLTKSAKTEVDQEKFTDNISREFGLTAENQILPLVNVELEESISKQEDTVRRIIKEESLPRGIIQENLRLTKKSGSRKEDRKNTDRKNSDKSTAIKEDKEIRPSGFTYQAIIDNKATRKPQY